MRQSNAIAVLLLSGLTLVSACEDDPAQPEADLSGFLPLTSRDAVLNNIEVAWNKRAASGIEELLDGNFTFYFAPGDVGGEIPVQWPRTDELATTTALFTSNSVPPANGPVCTSVSMDLDLEDVTWVEFPDTVLDEVLHIATVYYNFTFQMEPDQTYLSQSGSMAQFAVREVAAGSGTEWRLLELRDVGNGLVAGPEQTASTNERTWGSIKALYR